MFNSTRLAVRYNYPLHSACYRCTPKLWNHPAKCCGFSAESAEVMKLNFT